VRLPDSASPHEGAHCKLSGQSEACSTGSRSTSRRYHHRSVSFQTYPGYGKTTTMFCAAHPSWRVARRGAANRSSVRRMRRAQDYYLEHIVQVARNGILPLRRERSDSQAKVPSVLPLMLITSRRSARAQHLKFWFFRFASTACWLQSSAC
jgi:hypothetical protein